MDSLSKTEKFSFPLGRQQEWKVAGCDEAEGHSEERGPWQGVLGTAAELEIRRLAEATPRLHCAEGARGIAPSLSGCWVDLVRPSSIL